MLLFWFETLPGIDLGFRDSIGNPLLFFAWSLCSGFLVTNLVMSWRPRTAVFLDPLPSLSSSDFLCCLYTCHNSPLSRSRIYCCGGGGSGSLLVCGALDPEMKEQLLSISFDIRSACCDANRVTNFRERVPCDRKLLKECVSIWFGSQQVLNHTVRSEVSEILSHDLILLHSAEPLLSMVVRVAFPVSTFCYTRILLNVIEAAIRMSEFGATERVISRPSLLVLHTNL